MRRLLSIFILTRAAASVLAPPRPAGPRVITPPSLPPTADGGAPVSPRPGSPRNRWWRRRRLITFLVALAVVGGGVAAWAYFGASASAGSNGAAKAGSVGAGMTPSVSLSANGRQVDVSWGASTLANGQPVSGYIVTRYPSGGGLGDINPFSGCGGTVTGTSCSETFVPTGTWKYTVTPVYGTNWRGAESPLSGTVTVGPQSLSLTGSPFGNAAFTGSPSKATATGSIGGFAGGETVAYNLDSNSPPAGTALTGSPTTLGSSGNSASVSVGIPKSAGDGAHTVWALGTNSSYHPSQASAGIVIDTVAPNVSASLSPAANGAGWNNTSPVQVTLTETDPAPSSGVGTIKYTTDNSDPTTSGTALTYGGPFNVSAQGTTTIKFYGTDAAGNASPVATQLVKIDTVAPTNSISLNPISGSEILSGSTLWYRGVNPGSFTLSNAVADALSGPASSSYAALAGTSTGWSFTSSSSTTGPNYTSNLFSWTAGSSSSPTETVTGFDVAGNFTSAPAIAFSNDSTGPAGGSVSVTGLTGTNSAYSTSTTLSLSLATGSDAGVGNAASSTFVLKRASATLSSSGTADGSCGSFGAFATIATGPGSSYTDNAAGGIATGNCYQYQYVVSDLLGNQTTYTSNVVKVDTTAPSTPSNAALTPVTGTGFQFVSGSTLWYNPAQAGSFTADSSTSDGQSGISQVLFPTIGGFSGGGAQTTANSGTTFRSTYSWNSNGGSASPGSQTITSSNNAGLSASNASAFTLTKDATAPTTSDNAPSGWKNTSVTVTLTPTDNSGGSGVANTYYTTDGSTPTTSSSSGTSISLTSDGIYPIKYFSVDNVGNQESVKTAANQVEIDKANPNAPAVAPSGNTFTSGGGTIYIRNGVSLTDAATDPTVNGASSGVASVQYLYCSPAPCAPATPIGSSSTGPSYSFTWSGQPADGTYQIDAKVTDNAGNTTTSTKTTIVIDNTPPSTSDNTGTLGSGWFNTNKTVTLTPTDAGSGVAATYYTSGSPTAATPTTGSSQGTSVLLNGDGVWQVKYFSVDNVGNPESVETAGTLIHIDETAPNAGAVVTSGAFVSGSTYIKNGQALTDTTASDPTVNGASSGVATVQYWYCSSSCGGTTPTSSPASWTAIGSSSTASSYSVTWNSQPADGTYSLIAGVTDNANNLAYSALKTVVIDNTAPTTTATPSPSANGAGWNKANVSITLSANDGAGSGVASTTYSESGAQTLGNTAYSGAFTINTEGTTVVTFHSTDNLGNTETNKTVTIKLDKTAPNISIVSITAGGTTTCEFVNGSNAWYSTTASGNSCGSASGSFTVNASASDSGSGVNDVLFPSLTGSGFSGGGDVLAPGPYSSSYGWTNTTSGSPSANATATDVAGNPNTAAFSFTLDNTGPNGAITSPAAGNINGTVTLASDPSTTGAKDNSGGSGVKSVAYYRCTGNTTTCSGNPPSGTGGWTQIGSAATSSPYNVSLDTTTIPNGAYTVKAILTDNVGNQSVTGALSVTVSNTYTFVLGSISSPQRAGTAFSGFTIQLQVNGSNTGSFGGASYSGAHTIAFGGSATGNSPNSSTASGLSQSLTFNASGQATAGNVTLVKAESSGVITATDSGNSITGTSNSFATDSAGVTLSFNPSGTVTFTLNQSKSFTVVVPNDSFGNAFTSAAGVTVNLTLSSPSHWSFDSQGAGHATKALSITSGPAGNTFTVFENGNNGGANVTLSGSVASPFVNPTSDTLTE